MTKAFIVKEQDGALTYDEALLLKNPGEMSILDHPLRIKLIKLLSKTPMYPAELAKELKIHEQKIYYHIKLLANAGIIEIKDKMQIRGTTAKKFSPRYQSFAFSISSKAKGIDNLLKEGKESKSLDFFGPFIDSGRLNAKIIVGSPDPHGPYKARAGDSHYAIELGMLFGSLCKVGERFSVKFDVAIDLKKEESNLIIIGGPVTNLAMAKINEFLPAKFSDEKPWGIIGKGTHSEENVGAICRIPNPFHPNLWILTVAGVRNQGTKTAIIALCRHLNLALSKFSGQKEFACIVEGFDLDGDGEIDGIELLE